MDDWNFKSRTNTPMLVYLGFLILVVNLLLLFFIGPDMDSIVQIADLTITVTSGMDISAENYCKPGYELLFKYSDNSPICVTTENTAKLINIGLAFD